MVRPEQLREYADKIEQIDAEEEELKNEMQDLFTASFDTYVMSQHEEISKLSEAHGINATEARKQLVNFPNEYIVQDQTVPDLIKKMRKARNHFPAPHELCDGDGVVGPGLSMTSISPRGGITVFNSILSFSIFSDRPIVMKLVHINTRSIL